MDKFSENPNSLHCKCNNSSFADRHHKHMVTGDLQIIINNVLRTPFIKGIK